MSTPKITSKNLTYHTPLPPFLARLQASNAPAAAALDGRHERGLARPRRAPAAGDEEDEPAYVDESTNEVLDRDEVGKLLGGRDEKKGESREGEQDDVLTGTRDGTGRGSEETDKFGRRIRREGDTNRGSVAGAEEKTQTQPLAAPPPKTQEKLATIGSSRKRNIGKIIQADSDETEESRGEERSAPPTEGDKSSKHEKRDKDAKTNTDALPSEKNKKKKKKIKLSFGDE